MVICDWWSCEQELDISKSVEAEFGAAKEVVEGSFRRDLFGYYDDLSNIKMIEDAKDCAGISIIRTSILEVIRVVNLLYVLMVEQVADVWISPWEVRKIDKHAWIGGYFYLGWRGRDEYHKLPIR